jgi:1,4-alpha-glucan branching enzyme
MGFTHVELLPLAEHPFYGSWGYQPTGFFAPTGRYGTPQDLMYLVDHLHQQGIGLIFDWVRLHFPYDGHGLAKFDGTCLFEHPDWRNHHHPQWGTVMFDYERPEVRSFMLSNALFWLRQYHADGLRADAVSYMLYRDYGRRPGQWTTNRNGGRENLEAVAFLKDLHQQIAEEFPDVLTCAEEAAAYPQVSHPARVGGLGFTFKWDMGWMHDRLEYLGKPFHARRGHGDNQALLVVCHFLPGVLRNYRIGVPWPGFWRELLISDARDYGGSGAGNNGGLHTEEHGWHGRP